MYSINNKTELLNILANNNNTNNGVVIVRNQCYFFQIVNNQVKFIDLFSYEDNLSLLETTYIIIKDKNYHEAFSNYLLNSKQLNFLANLPTYTSKQINEISNVNVEDHHQYQIIDAYILK